MAARVCILRMRSLGARPAQQCSTAEPQPTCDCCVKPPRPGGSARALVLMPPSRASRSRSRPRAAVERVGGQVDEPIRLWAGDSLER